MGLSKVVGVVNVVPAVVAQLLLYFLSVLPLLLYVIVGVEIGEVAYFGVVLPSEMTGE